PTVADDVRVRLVVREHGAARSGPGPELFVPALLRRQQMDVVGQRRLGQDDRHVTRLERRAQPLDVVELGDPDAPGYALREPALDRSGAPVLQVDEALLEVPVI